MQAGNTAFQQQRHQQAADEYSKAVDVSVEDPSFNAVLYGNRAAAHHALGRYVDAIADCFSAASLDPAYIRVLQRRADAYVAIGDHSNAAQVQAVVLHVGSAHLSCLCSDPSCNIGTKNAHMWFPDTLNGLNVQLYLFSTPLDILYPSVHLVCTCTGNRLTQPHQSAVFFASALQDDNRVQ